jgi:uncharacterized repeat protein (TIGR03803 family)
LLRKQNKLSQAFHSSLIRDKNTERISIGWRSAVTLHAVSPKVSWTGVLVVLFAGILPAGAQTFAVLYEFSGGADGATPSRGSLFVDSKGNIFGSTVGGGDTACNPATKGCGVTFKIDSKGKETVLHTFSGNPDGAEPYVTVILNGANGGYGVAEYGGTGPCKGLMGPSGCGAIIKIDHTGKESVVYSFTASPDGSTPQSGLVRDALGNVYGATEQGGTFNDGTVFKVDPSGKETVLYSFTGSPDGQFPGAGVVRDKAGNLYGTTWYGGANLQGTVFEVEAGGKETVLHTFGSGSDGQMPLAGLTLDAAGNLYGTTYGGGAYGYGTVFGINLTTGQETILYSFAGYPIDGGYPEASVVFDAYGNVYGTTWIGGTNNDGTVFKIDSAGNESLLHSFSGSDGDQIYGGLVSDAAGNLYGTALFGGSYSEGLVFKVTP